MTAQLRQISAAPALAPVDWRPAWREVVFSVRAARSALPYIARIAADAAAAFHVVRRSREALDVVCAVPAMRTDLQRRRDIVRHLCEQRDSALRRLDNAIDDCNSVGVDLIDIPGGIVCLPGEIDGRPVSLLWRLGENVTDAWDDLGAV